MTESHMLFNCEPPIAMLTLNRPESRNAFSDDMLDLWQQYLHKAQKDDRIQVIVVTGKGRSFCSGGDVRQFAEGTLTSWNMKRYIWEGVHRVALTLEDIDKPVIAAINGHAMGAGLDMALMCDLRVCSDQAKLGESYINMGLVPGDGGAYFLPKLVGIAKALELLLTGDVLSAKEALQLGIVNKVVPHDQLLDDTLALANRIASKPPLAIRMIKRAVYQAQDSSLRSHLDYISSHMALLSETADHREAAKAFLAKRKPIFQGK